MSGCLVCLQLTVMSSITFNYSYFHGGLFPSVIAHFNAPTRLKNQKAQKYYFLFFSSIADMRRSDTQENERERERKCFNCQIVKIFAPTRNDRHLLPRRKIIFPFLSVNLCLSRELLIGECNLRIEEGVFKTILVFAISAKELSSLR